MIFGGSITRNLELPVPLNQPGTNPSQLGVSPLLVCKERNLHDSDFNPSRLTRQPFFRDLVDYLDQHDDVILREIKAQFPEVAVDKLLEEYIKAGLIFERKQTLLSQSSLSRIYRISCTRPRSLCEG